MGYSRVVSVSGRKCPWVSAGSVLLFAVLGCGNIYRPVVTSLPPVQPAAQPNKYAVVISCGSATNPSAPTIDQICNTTGAPGVASVVDYAGDSLSARINLGTGGPRWLVLSNNGATAYAINADTTINSFGANNTIESHQVNTSTLPPTPAGAATPNTMLFTNQYIYVSQPGRSSIEVLNSLVTPPSAVLEIPVVQNPVNIVGTLATQRVYAISQGTNAGTCPGSGGNGTVTSIETTTNTPSATLPVGPCPIYGVMSPDGRRTFILNQGGNTITVIDSQQNQVDPNYPNGITVGQGPVWADIINNESVLAVANSGSNTVSLINIALDSFGHDGPNFGQIIATIPVGPNPSSISVLQDGTQAYVANRNNPASTTDPAGNGSVSVINLTTNTVNATISLPQEPCAGNPTVLCNVHPMSIAATTGTPTGKVYVSSPDTNYLTIIRTDNDTIAENLSLAGNGVQVRVTAP
jgi:DNA-binding beta-propeller fold protein YncE